MKDLVLAEAFFLFKLSFHLGFGADPRVDDRPLALRFDLPLGLLGTLLSR